MSKKPQKQVNAEKAQTESTSEFYVVGIGASAGGLDAIQRFFDYIPANTNIAFCVIQHLSPNFKSQMSELLQRHSQMNIKVAEDGEILKPNNIYLNNKDSNLIIRDGRLTFVPKSDKNILNLPIDLFFHSLANEFLDMSIGVIMSGTGTDGSRGIQSIRQAGGTVMVQHPDSAQFNGMPLAALNTKHVEYVGIPEELAIEVSKFPNKISFLSTVETGSGQSSTEVFFSQILDQLYANSGIDFRKYKYATLIRRLEKRLNFTNQKQLSEYLQYLKQNQDEKEILQKDFLIGVTNFFRDKEAFDYIQKELLKHIFENKGKYDVIRIWVAACSTGEEAYSLAILMEEYLRKHNLSCNYKIFATDVDNEAIEHASLGEYTVNIIADMQTEYLNKYFLKIGNNFRIVKSIREKIVFSKHNILRDPPFIKMDMISCRNMLIYINNNFQEKILRSFQFALNTGGFLFLGSSENLGTMKNDYLVMNNKWKIYKLQNKLSANVLNYQMTDRIKNLAHRKTQNIQYYQQREPFQIKEKIFTDSLLSQYAPNSLFINSEYQILYIQGDLNKYLKLNTGIPNPNLLNMIDTNLSSMVKNGIRRSKEENKEIIFKDIEVKKNGEKVNIRFKRLKLIPNNEIYLIIFDQEVEHSTGAIVYDQYELDEFSKQRIEDLEKELKEKEAEIHNIVEELETSNEELQTSNEELLSSNEELQSTNEELQSVNEELYTVNTEMQARNKELSDLTNDIDNLLKSTDIGTLFVDRNLNIRKFTPALRSLFNLNDGDIGRPITDFASNFNNDKPEVLTRRIRHVIDTLLPFEEEIRDIDGNYFLRRITPFVTNNKIIDGAVITMVDISLIKKAEFLLRDQKEKLTDFMESATDAFTLWNDNLELVEINSAGLSLFPSGTKKESIIGKNISDLDQGLMTPSIQKNFNDVLKSGKPVSIDDTTGNTSSGLLFQRKIFKAGDGIGTIFTNITDKAIAAENIKISEAKYRGLFEQLSSGFALHKVIFDSKGKPIDYIFLEGNKKFEEITNLSFSEIAGKKVTEVFPGIENNKPDLIGIYGEVAKTGKPTKLEFQFSDIENKWFQVSVFRPMKNHFATVFEDITLKKSMHDTMQSERERLLSIFNGLNAYIYIVDPENNKILFANKEIKKHFGNDVEGKICYEVFHNNNEICNFCTNDKIFDGHNGAVYEWEFYNSKTNQWLQCYDKALKWDNRFVRFEMATDITERKHIEQALVDSEQNYSILFENTPAGIYQCDLDGKLSFSNSALRKILNLNLAKKSAPPVLPWIKYIEENKKLRTQLQKEKFITEFEFEYQLNKNQSKHLIINITKVNNMYSGMVFDNTQRKQAQLDSNTKQQVLAFAEEIGNIGSWELNIRENKMYLSDNALHIFGIEPDKYKNDVQSLINLIHPSDRKMFENIIYNQNGSQSRDFYVVNILRPNDNFEKQISGTSYVSFDENKNPLKVNGIIFDISEEQKTKDNLVKLNKELLDTNEKLSRTNNELRQFAYITSHDLNEPLRMITSFLGLITKNYSDKLDDEGREYINYAVDGAERMKKLIRDLLIYSRIDTRASQHINVNLIKVMDNVLQNLDFVITESKAIIKMDKLPVVNAEPSQMTQLFQNLVANALKFRGKNNPEVNITVNDKDPYWEFAVEDNGIGIKSEYFDKIFGIFERLHSREEYDGTGIGLAVCKKIVERHNGTIWVESKIGKGSTFYFTIPKKL